MIEREQERGRTHVISAVSLTKEMATDAAVVSAVGESERYLTCFAFGCRRICHPMTLRGRRRERGREREGE